MQKLQTYLMNKIFEKEVFDQIIMNIYLRTYCFLNININNGMLNGVFSLGTDSIDHPILLKRMNEQFGIHRAELTKIVRVLPKEPTSGDRLNGEL